MNIDLPEPDDRVEMETWEIEPTSSFAFRPRIFQSRIRPNKPIMVTFKDVPCPCCAARQRFWSSFWRILPMAVVSVLMIGLMCAAREANLYEYSKTAFASYAPQPRTTPAPQVVLAPSPTTTATTTTNLFSLDAGLLSQSMTPARLTESQGEALFKVLSLDEDEPVAPPLKEKVGCDDDDCWCLFLAVVNHFEPYYPAFITSYFQGDSQEDKNDAVEPPFDYFDWVISVDEAVFHGTTPASLPLVNEESASAFYQMTLGHAPKIKKSQSVVESAESAAFDTTTAWPGTDALFAIVRQVIDFGQSTSDSIIAIFRSATTPPAGQENFWTFFSDVQENFWTYLILYVTIVSLDIFWDVRFWSLDYPLGCLFLLKLLLRTVSHLLLNARLSRVPLFGAQILSKAARGIKETLRWLSKIGWREAAESDNGDGLVGDMEEVRAARQRRVALERSVFGDGDWV